MPSASPARAKNFSTLQSACLEPNNQVCDASKVQSDNSFGMLNRQQENEEYEENAGSCCCVNGKSQGTGEVIREVDLPITQ
jgi:hypothetical protein